MPGSKRVSEAEAEASASVATGPTPESSPLSSPLSSPSRHTPSLLDVDPSHRPKVGLFIHPATEGLYDKRILASSSNSETQFDDDTDEGNTEADDLDVDETRLGGPERVLRRFRLDYQRKRFVAKYSGMWASDHESTKSRGDWDCEMFPGLEGEGDLPVEEDETVQTKEERREASRQRQKKVCKANGCHGQGCRMDHVRRGNVEYFLQNLDERTSQLNEPAEEVAALVEGSTIMEGVKRSVYLRETGLSFESQFESLLSSIIEENGRN
jgi:hypothetical protein